MTKERRAELAKPFQKAEKLQTKKELESKILKPIYDRILKIQQRKNLNELDKLATYLAKRIATETA